MSDIGRPTSQPTPGPWLISGDEHALSFTIYSPKHTTGYDEDDDPYNTICSMPSGSYSYACAIDAPANARLIAAAPELLDALEEIAHWLETYANKSVFDTFPEQALREALKATGAA